MSERKYLVEYFHEGSYWALQIVAASHEDAQNRLRQLQYGRVLGEVQAEIPARFGWIAKLICWLKGGRDGE